MSKSRLAALVLFLGTFYYTPQSNAVVVNLNSLKKSELSFENDGKQILVDVYEPNTPGTYPAILLLYGAGGLLFDGSRIEIAAQRLVRAGYKVYLVHYFNQTNTMAARGPIIEKNFATWLQTVRASIPWLEKQQGYSAPIGIYGFSLGGFLAVAAASDNSQVGAVVEQAGGIVENKTEMIGHMPPVLLVHGKHDSRVPFEKYAEPMLAVFRERGTKVETRFFPHEGHNFSPTALDDAREHAIDFFRRHLHERNSFAHRAGAPRR
jgi:carboxymethylenebutenolidase